MSNKISITAPERSFNEYISNPRNAFIEHNTKCQPIYMAGILLIIFLLLSFNSDLLANQVAYSIQENA